MNTTAIGAADLLVLLEREFRRREPRNCPRCAASLPFHVSPSDRQAGSWQIVPLGECPNRCVSVLDEIVGEFQRRYRLFENGLA